MKRILIFAGIIFIAIVSKADNYPIGASSLGYANSSVAVPTLWSVYHNQAALAFLDKNNVGLYYENRFNFQEMSLKSLAFSMNLKPGTIGFSVSNFGFSQFSDNKFGLAYSMKLTDYLALGIQLDYVFIHQPSEYGNTGAIAGEIGMFANPFENFYLGAHIFNPWRARISQYQDERLPTIFRIGMAYDFSEQVKYSLEIEKDLDMPARFKTGIQYELIDNLILRTGVAFSDKNFLPAFGVGYTYKDITIDLAFESHPLLGFKSGVSVYYSF